MEFGDRIGQCECCDKENVLIQYSMFYCEWLCANCWEILADYIIGGE